MRKSCNSSCSGQRPGAFCPGTSPHWIRSCPPSRAEMRSRSFRGTVQVTGTALKSVLAPPDVSVHWPPELFVNATPFTEPTGWVAGQPKKQNLL
jgi:hypothetical protein